MRESMIDNKNAEKWDLEAAKDIFNKAIKMVRNKEVYNVGTGQNAVALEGYKYHFLGELAVELNQYPDLFKYLANVKYKELKTLYNRLKGALEANCFSDSKKGIIKEATAIMNLKSNYGWTDRLDATTKDQPINKPIDLRKAKTETLEKLLKEIEDGSEGEDNE